jgi:hypothetical protein
VRLLVRRKLGLLQESLAAAIHVAFEVESVHPKVRIHVPFIIVSSAVSSEFLLADRAFFGFHRAAERFAAAVAKFLILRRALRIAFAEILPKPRRNATPVLAKEAVFAVRAVLAEGAVLSKRPVFESFAQAMQIPPVFSACNTVSLNVLPDVNVVQQSAAKQALAYGAEVLSR